VGKFKIIIDFHNYGYTILNLSVKNMAIIKIATLYEKYFAKKANGFLCVSNKMK
jgi:beta-1,4-mannosyltransferase